MKVFLLKNVEKIGLAGEIVTVKEGFADNYLVPRQLGVVITPENEKFYQKRLKTVENRKQAIESQISMLAEKIKSLKATLKRKAHNNGQLYGSISPLEIVEFLKSEGIGITKNQVIFENHIKSTGIAEVIIKLSPKFQPKMHLHIIPE